MGLSEINLDISMQIWKRANSKQEQLLGGLLPATIKPINFPTHYRNSEGGSW